MVGAALVTALVAALLLGTSGCAQTSRYGVTDERSEASGDHRTDTTVLQGRLRRANFAVAAVPAPPRPRPNPSAQQRRLMQWVHGQIHGQKCRLPADTFSRPLGVYFGERYPRKRVVLTFDDGPLVRRTDRILDLLRKHRHKAVFFVVGSMIHGATFRTVQRILREGHILANHSYHHRTRMAKHRRARETIRVELLLNQAMVDIALLARTRRQFNKLRLRLLGGEKRSRFPGAILRMWPVIAANWRAILREYGKRDGLSPYAMRYARPPGGNPLMGRWTRAQRRDYAAAAQGLGLITVLWSSASADSTPGLSALQRKDAVRVVSSIVRGAHRGGVLLMHDWMNSAHLDLALGSIALSRTLRVVSLHGLVRRKFGCDSAWLTYVVQAQERRHRRKEQQVRRARCRKAKAASAPGRLRKMAAPAPAPPPSQG